MNRQTLTIVAIVLLVIALYFFFFGGSTLWGIIFLVLAAGSWYMGSQRKV